MADNRYWCNRKRRSGKEHQHTLVNKWIYEWHPDSDPATGNGANPDLSE
jgi:hypothetical protein